MSGPAPEKRWTTVHIVGFQNVADQWAKKLETHGAFLACTWTPDSQPTRSVARGVDFIIVFSDQATQQLARRADDEGARLGIKVIHTSSKWSHSKETLVRNRVISDLPIEPHPEEEMKTPIKDIVALAPQRPAPRPEPTDSAGKYDEVKAALQMLKDALPGSGVKKVTVHVGDDGLVRASVEREVVVVRSEEVDL